MLSCVRKIVEATIAMRIARTVTIHPRKFGFQRGRSSLITLIDVNSKVKAYLDKIATLYLSKACYKFNRAILWECCRGLMDKNIINMLTTGADHHHKRRCHWH